VVRLGDLVGLQVGEGDLFSRREAAARPRNAPAVRLVVDADDHRLAEVDGELLELVVVRPRPGALARVENHVDIAVVGVIGEGLVIRLGGRWCRGGFVHGSGDG